MTSMADEKPKETESGRENQALSKLEKATKYRKFGGVIPFLMKEVNGYREFVRETLIDKDTSPEDFMKEMNERFPDIDKEVAPSVYAVRDFKRKLKKYDRGENEKQMAIKMKDEFEILRVMGEFNFFEERMYLYEKALQGLQGIIDLMKRTQNLPSEGLWKALRECSEHLAELDKLSVRFGMMPAPPNINSPIAEFFNNQANQLAKSYDAGDVDQTIERLIILQREIKKVRGTVEAGNPEVAIVGDAGVVVEKGEVSEINGRNDGGDIGVQESTAHQGVVSDVGQPENKEDSVGSTEKPQ